MTTFKEVAHFYLGCKCLIGKKDWMPTGVPLESQAPYTDHNFGKPIYCDFDTHVLQQYLHRTTLILRRVEDMTDAEKEEMSNQKHQFDTGNGASHAITDYAYKVNWALSKGFDLFNLIDNGQAIDAKNYNEKGKV